MKNIEQNEEIHPVWIGEPYKGLYLRPGDVSQNIFCTIFGLILCYYLILDHAWALLSFVTLFIFYTTIGRLVHDATIRKKLRYELWPTGLIVLDKNSQKRLKFIPISKLTVLSPSWSGPIASIDLPLGRLHSILLKFNGWDKAVPALSYGRRIELIENPASVAKLISNFAKCLIKEATD